MLLKKIKEFENILKNKDNEKLICFLKEIEEKYLVKIILFKYENLINMNITNYFYDHNFLHFSKEDVFNSFIGKLSQILKNYKPSLEVAKFDTYLAKTVKLFTLNYINFWNSKKRKLTNVYLETDNLIVLKDPDAENSITKELDKIDTNSFWKSLSLKDKEFCKQMILGKNKSIFMTSQKINKYKQKIYNKFVSYFNY
ncbi:hypothetical protein MCSF7_02973 [Mycoplasmopsis columbina SF7]|uniref:Uncharacterized protein n=1 Tax=Mycoplasmopsis columbina SF7 TaxID=1037410 RepID=F9UJD6_9BACT|nr:hypothetical protein [Mycoplasmopsis columbina]EGV00479.1 hypothetical protein MCSF7_02973 [Mycoplasmopsis columbina SF7]